MAWMKNTHLACAEHLVQSLASYTDTHRDRERQNKNENE